MSGLVQLLDFDKGGVHAVDLDAHAILASQQDAARGAAFAAHHDARLNPKGRAMMPDNVEQDRADRDAFADGDIDERAGCINQGRGEHRLVLVAGKHEFAQCARTVIREVQEHLTVPEPIGAPGWTSPTVGESRTPCSAEHRHRAVA